MLRFDAHRARIFVVLSASVLTILGCLAAFHGMACVRAAERDLSAADANADTNTIDAPSVTTDSPARLLPSSATPVLVELFTSEGCSSCPSADALLARLQQAQPVPAADILALEEHVDYWDSLGWRDRFSSQQFSARQTAYIQRLQLDTEYTPQMIVDGTDQFAGNDFFHALRSIAQAAREPKLALSLSPLILDGDQIAGTVSVPPLAPPAHSRSSRRHTSPTQGASSLPNADVYAVVVQPIASTQVLGGENGGRTLHHVSVVREMSKIGSLASASASQLKFSLSVPGDASTGDLRIVVFVQRAGQGAILGATSSPSVAIPATEAAIAATGSAQ